MTLISHSAVDPVEPGVTGYIGATAGLGVPSGWGGREYWRLNRIADDSLSYLIIYSKLYPDVAERLATMAERYEKGGRSADFASFMAQIRQDYCERLALMKVLDARRL